MVDGDLLPASQQETIQQHELDDPTRQGTTQEEQEVHDFDAHSFCILASYQQVYTTGIAAKARRNNKPEKQQKQQQQQQQEKFNASLLREKKLMLELRDKDRIIQQKNIEIREQCKRINDMKGLISKFGLQECIIQRKDKEIGKQCAYINDLKQSLQEMKREHREHRAEMERRDYTETVLLADLRELCQVHDEEVEVLRKTIDRQALPSPYFNIDNQVPIPLITDAGPANPSTVISSATTSLHKTIASLNLPSKTSATQISLLASCLHASLFTIHLFQKSNLWPGSSALMVLHAISDLVDCVTGYLVFHHTASAPSTFSSNHFLAFFGSTSRAFASLRNAFTAADTFALETCFFAFFLCCCCCCCWGSKWRASCSK